MINRWGLTCSDYGNREPFHLTSCCAWDHILLINLDFQGLETTAGVQGCVTTLLTLCYLHMK